MMDMMAKLFCENTKRSYDPMLNTINGCYIQGSNERNEQNTKEKVVKW